MISDGKHRTDVRNQVKPDNLEKAWRRGKLIKVAMNLSTSEINYLQFCGHCTELSRGEQ